MVDFYVVILFVTREFKPHSSLGRKIRKDRRLQRDRRHLVEIHHKRRFLRVG
jgi:hypothetical protein